MYFICVFVGGLFLAAALFFSFQKNYLTEKSDASFEPASKAMKTLLE
jgi:FHS family L-fucose permease-like MFS transporter